jgi:heme/copper-type cytochrome/quinol oxidase subunit 2
VVVTVLVVAGIALLVGLFFVFRSGSDDEPTGATTSETATTEQTTTTEETTTTEQTTTTAPQPEVATLSVAVRGARPVGGIQRLRVGRGDRVRIVVRSDVADEVHLHGYDLAVDVAPGNPARLELRATIAGRFEIELEEAGTPIAELEVR